ncbi:MAG: energy-coupling factor transporter transmembrane protein EcfT [Ruminiclostridium sp.]|nr:energy-coupling factor transporter transmembrane protein EcfT [Ruminiclostridium sp.]
MKELARIDPIAVMIYYVCVIGIAMFIMHPVIICISLVGAVALFVTIDIKRGIKLHLSFFLLFLILAVINPIWYHNGATVLFVVNDSPVTLEALLYGVFAAAMIISVLYRFRTFALVMTADKLMRVFGMLSPKAALILSMALRYVPLMRRQTAKIRNTQRALGITSGESIAETLKAEMRVFSIMATWSLENGIITADSMEARGYGEHRRTNYSTFRFGMSDGIFTAVCLLLTGTVITTAVLGELNYGFYPAMSEISAAPLAVTAYTAYGALSMLPAVLEWKEALRWKYLLSKV